jgi:hypothetical protein
MVEIVRAGKVMFALGDVEASSWAIILPPEA